MGRGGRDLAGRRVHPALFDVTTLPRPFDGSPRVWHGSATTLFSAALAGKWGDPLFSANALQPLEVYGVLVDHYRSEYARHGHAPGATTSPPAPARCSSPTPRRTRSASTVPVYDAIVAATNVPGNNTLYRDIQHAVADGPVLVGTAQQVIDKIARFHDRLGHSLQSISLPTTVPFEQQLEILERFATEVIPVLAQGASDDPVDGG